MAIASSHDWKRETLCQRQSWRLVMVRRERNGVRGCAAGRVNRAR